LANVLVQVDTLLKAAIQGRQKQIKKKDSRLEFSHPPALWLH